MLVGFRPTALANAVPQLVDVVEVAGDRDILNPRGRGTPQAN